jgi:large repetitive protein
MKNFSNQYKSKMPGKLKMNLWLYPLQCFRLLIASLTRIRKNIFESFFLMPEEEGIKKLITKRIAQYQIINCAKTKIMKHQNRLLKWSVMLLLLISGANAMAQGPFPNTGDHLVCLNSTEPYGVALNAGSTYAWSVTPLAGGNGTITPGAAPNLITVNWTSAGTATLQVIETNAGGCEGDPVTIIVTINPLPTVTVNSSAICAGTSATITATPGAAGTYNYVWTVPGGAANPGNIASFTSGIAGTYAVVITNTVTKCGSASASGTVTITAAPTLLITSPASVCGTGTVDLTAPAVTTGSTAGMTFTYWTDAAATIAYATPAAATTGTYYIKGTLGAGCFDIKPVIVTTGAAPTLVVTNAAVCGTATVDLTAAAITAGSTAGLTFTYWTDAAASVPYATPTTATAGTYYIKGTTAAGCFVIKPVVITTTASPALVITNPTSACGTGTVDLTAASITAGSTAGMTFTYWTDAAATTAYATPATATAGTYYIKGTVAGGCSDIKPVVVGTGVVPTVVITNPAAVCAPNTVDLTAATVTAGSTTGLTFTYWTDAAATTAYATPAAATAGTYYIKGTSASGCFDIKPVVVTVTPAPTVAITTPATVCAPNTVDLTNAAVTAGSTSGLTFTYWTDAAATIPYATPAAATAGTYYIKGTSAGGCSDIKPVIVTVNPLPTPVITGPTPVCVSVTGTTSTYTTPNVAGHTYNWTVTGGTIATGQGTNTITVTWTTAGAGSVNVTETITATGCFKAAAPLAVTVNPKPVTTPITHN